LNTWNTAKKLHAELTTLVYGSHRAKILLNTELTTLVQYSSGVLSKIVDLPNSVVIKIDTIQHYKLTNKQVTEFLKTRETV